MKKVNFIFAFMFVCLSGLSVAEAQVDHSRGFISKGVGYFCYQGKREALLQAQADADKKASLACSRVGQRAQRVTAYAEIPTNYCAAQVKAGYVCL